MSSFDINLKALRDRFPVAARRIEQASASASSTGYTNEEIGILADLWLANRRWSSQGIYCVSGWCDGWHVEALLAVLPQDAWILVVENDPAVLRRWMAGADVRGVLGDPRLLVGVGRPDEAFFSCLDEVPILDVGEVLPVVFAPGYNRAPAEYATAFTEFARQVNTRRKLWGTAVVDAPLWQSNTFANLARLAAAPDVAALSGAFAGWPMVLVSAGPSLDESLEFVREASRSALVVAVNSSYRAVRHAGVIPHFVLAADPRQFVAMGFRGVAVGGSWLLTTPIVNPEVVAMFEDRCLTWSGSNEIFTEMRRRCGLPVGTTLVEHGTVSACAVDLAALLGCDRVCLVGQDLAVRTDGRTHAVDTFYSDLKLNAVDPGKCRMLSGNTLDRVPVEEKLYVYLKAFEQLVARMPHMRFCNTARLGARIEGVDYVPLASAPAWLGMVERIDPRAIIERAVTSGPGATMTAGQILRVVGRLDVFAREVLAAALKAASMIEGLPDRYASENYRDAAPVRAAIQSARDLRKILSAQPRDTAILEAGQTRLELYRCRRAQKLIAAGAEHWVKIMREREYAWAMAEGAWFLVRRLEESIRTLGGVPNPR